MQEMHMQETIVPGNSPLNHGSIGSSGGGDNAGTDISLGQRVLASQIW